MADKVKMNMQYLYTAFQHQALDFANNYTKIPISKISKDEPDIDVDGKIWVGTFDAFQEGVKTALAYIEKNYDLSYKTSEELETEKLIEAGEKTDNRVRFTRDKIKEHLKDIQKENRSVGWKIESVQHAYVALQNLVSSIEGFENNVTNRSWIVNRLLYSLDFKPEIICDETNNPASAVDAKVVVVRVMWKEQNLITKYTDLIFGKELNINSFMVSDIM